ncbi:MAG: DUF1549 domain-containing protein [Pirellulaceae bacterium]
MVFAPAFQAGALLLVTLLCLYWLGGQPTLAQDDPAPFGLASSLESAPSFEADIVPLLSQCGCNAAACHGAAGGRGGFSLSLFGARPRDDFAAITHAEQGRRLQWDEPENSLLLTKPTETIDHEGGMRFDIGSPPWSRLRDWIAAGAPYGEPLAIAAIEARPSVITAVSGSAEATVQVWAYPTATDFDKQPWDVTRDVVVEAEDPASVEVHGTTFRATRPGEHRVFIRYADKYEVVRLVVPVLAPSWDGPPPSTPIDRSIETKLDELGLIPQAQASRHALVRRLYLDLAGRLPNEQEAQDWHRETRPDAWARRVDVLLASPDFDRVWTHRLASWLAVDGLGDEVAAQCFRDWIAEQVRADADWAESVGQMVVARGDSHRIGPAGFYRGTTDPRLQAERFSEQLLGTRLRCANCHDHPLDQWTQDDYHGLAAIFARVSQNRMVEDRPAGEVLHPRTQYAAVPKLPAEASPSADLTTNELQQWLDADPYANHQRDLVMVNRVWSVLLGRGLVHPTDDWRATNPATHPALLEQLNERFRVGEGAMRPLVRHVLMTDAYRRGSGAAGEPLSSDEQALRWHDRGVTLALTPELLIDALTQVTEVSERTTEAESIPRAIDLVTRATTSPSLTTLGRCPVGGACDSTASVESRDLRQGLHWLNGPLVNARLEQPTGWLMHSWREAGRADVWLERYLDAWHWRCFARPATDNERVFWESELLLANEPGEQVEILIDLAWTTLASREFWSRP